MTDLHRATAHHFSIAGNDGQFFYWTVGNPQNPPLLCINGFTGTHSDLLALARELKEDFYLIIPDLPGWGASDRLKESQTLNHYGKYLLELINHLQLKRVATLGHCMGAALSIEFAHMAPERSTHLVLISTPYVENNPVHDMFVRFSEWEKRLPALFSLFYFWRNKYLCFVTGLFILKFKTLRKNIAISVANFRNSGQQDLQVVRENWRSLMHFNYKKIKRLTIPIVLIYGALDIIIDKKSALAMAKYAPQAAVEFIPNAGHLPPAETPGAVATLVKKYLVT